MNRNFEAIFSPQTPHKMRVNFEKKTVDEDRVICNYYYWRIESTCVTHKLNVKTPRVYHNQMKLHTGSGDPCEQQPQNNKISIAKQSALSFLTNEINCFENGISIADILRF